MLSAHVVREGGHRYYVDDLVPGRAEDSRVAGEEPGLWTGDGAAALSVRGTVEGAPFAAVLDGRHPSTNERLRVRHGDRSVAAYDLTFGAPKSVSLLHLLGPRELAAEVGAGHRAAVDDATGYLSRRAVGVRRTRHGRLDLLPSTGVVAGAFLHRTSRTLDPHLHTHLVVANVAQGLDGSWSAVDSRRLYAHLQAAQGLYHARLRLELGARLGVAWELRGSGLGDVVGVDPRLRRLFSQRTAAVDELELRRSGRTGPSRARYAFLVTRPDKDRTRRVEALRAEWRKRAGTFGFDLGELTRVVGVWRALPGHAPIDVVRLRTGLAGRERRQIDRHDLVAEVAFAAAAGATADTVEALADRIAAAADGRSAGAGPVGPATRSHGPAGSGDRTGGRWRLADVLHVVEHPPDTLLAAVGHPDHRGRGPRGPMERSGRRLDSGRDGPVSPPGDPRPRRRPLTLDR